PVVTSASPFEPPQGAPRPPHETGEVVVRGASVMAGYLDAPAENAKGFFGDWFRTGDAGYLDGDGYLHLTGRLKEIINRGGEKISPREVDDLLLAHPAVADAATFAVAHESLGEEVAAAIVIKPGAALSRQEVIDYLQPRLAYYKVPRAVHFPDRIPKTAGGKLQRYKLSEAFGAAAPEPAGSDHAYVPPESPVAKAVAAMWARILEVPRVGLHDDFFDLGGDSLRGASFINDIQQAWGETVYVSALFDAPVLDQFEQHLHEAYPELAAKILGQSLSPGAAAGRIDAEKLAGFRRMIPRLGRGISPARDKNPRAVFVLTTPRSGSTLFRAMLGGSTRLFAPPELYLLNFDTLADRKDRFDGTQRLYLEGNIRAVMQLKDQTLEEAEGLLDELEARALPTQDYYREMQSWLGDRILVEKTPFYGIDVETLQRAEDWFEDPLYIHLTRHPYGMIRSFEEARLEQLWYPRLVGVEAAEQQPCPYQRREMAEMVWLVLHENILRFLVGVPANRRHRVAFEDLVGDPQATMMGVSAFLGLEYEAGMIAPHEDRRSRMTDGIHPVSRMLGDMKFHQHRGIDSRVADLWKDAYDTDFLSDQAWRVAGALGYCQTIADARDRKELVL
ncbi:MAG: sulfotransferase, partial [Paracoccaceae bacterium]